MSFSRAQQPEFRKLVKLAWAAHCRMESLAETDKAGERAWYEAQLFEATGNSTSRACNAGRDYDRAMAHFETVAGSGVKWNLRLFGGDAKRILHQLREVSDEHQLDEEYLRGVARRMLNREYLPELHTLSRETLITILGEVKRHIRRALKRGPAEQDEVVPSVSGFHRVRRGVVSPENCPF